VFTPNQLNRPSFHRINLSALSGFSCTDLYPETSGLQPEGEVGDERVKLGCSSPIHPCSSVRASGGGTKSPLYDNIPQPYAELFQMKSDGSGQRATTDDKWEEGTPARVPEGASDQGKNRQQLLSVAQNIARK
jgi:hypothetical protein